MSKKAPRQVLLEYRKAFQSGFLLNSSKGHEEGTEKCMYRTRFDSCFRKYNPRIRMNPTPFSKVETLTFSYLLPILQMHVGILHKMRQPLL